MNAIALTAVQAGTAALPQSVVRGGWLDPAFIGFLVGIAVQLFLIACVLLSRSPESEGEDT